MFLRLRQLCLVAEKLDPVVDTLCQVFGVTVCHRDPEVGQFGLHNALIPFGTSFIEVVAPVTEGTTAGRYLQRKGTVSKQTVPVRSSGPFDVCLAVPRPGRYAVAIHHDLNANGDKDINDGAGYSNNPRLSLTNLKPAFSRTAVQVGASPRRVSVVLQYRKGLSVRPVNG